MICRINSVPRISKQEIVEKIQTSRFPSMLVSESETVFDRFLFTVEIFENLEKNFFKLHTEFDWREDKLKLVNSHPILYFGPSVFASNKKQNFSFGSGHITFVNKR